MKGNEKIAFTAEAVACMRARENSDIFSKYFVSLKIKSRFNLVAKFIPNYLDNISRKRIILSKDLDKLIKTYKPEQIIELACGYSPRGLIFTQQYPKLVYIETDFPLVINRKKKILKEIEGEEGIILSKNHHLISLDAINKDLYNSLQKLIDRKKKTLIVAETLTSYLNPTEHNFLIKNIEGLLDKVNEGAYLSHERFGGMLSGCAGKLLLFYRDKVAHTRSYNHFNNINEIKNYFLKEGFANIKIIESQSNNLIYLVQRKSNS